MERTREEVQEQFDHGITEYGFVQKNGRDIALLQLPYIDGIPGQKPFYRAHGLDRKGKDYEIVWKVKDEWEQIEDETEMCEWDEPVEIISL